MESTAPSAAPSDLGALRAAFPVLAATAYLNAGTDGPLPERATAAAREELERELTGGRTGAHFERRRELSEALRSAYAGLLGCAVAETSLTSCTSEGISIVVGGLRLSPEDEILTSDEEHPGLLGALQAAAELDGVRVRMVPLAEMAAAVEPRTRLVACSHVSWMSGAMAPQELAGLGEEVPVLLDGAQGIGAVPVDVAALGCAAYAGSGQKWLCGPDGLGMLYVAPGLRERLAVSRRGYQNLENADAGLAARLHPDGRRFNAYALSAEAMAMALAALEVLAAAGWERAQARARDLAESLAERLEAAGRAVTPRDPSTLVAFSSEDPVAEREALARRGVVVRDVPGRATLRASVGAWNDEADLDRLVDALGG
ncbi:MAG: aminotransferase class V-fold PLP-dependent enzyme [Acidobacteriota bacterium]|nr:aminotransferase class V-fold PLP-dependent enzyme [Acidobacteriota bacterium]